MFQSYRYIKTGKRIVIIIYILVFLSLNSATLRKRGNAAASDVETWSFTIVGSYFFVPFPFYPTQTRDSYVDAAVALVRCRWRYYIIIFLFPLQPSRHLARHVHCLSLALRNTDGTYVYTRLFPRYISLRQKNLIIYKHIKVLRCPNFFPMIRNRNFVVVHNTIILY